MKLDFRFDPDQDEYGGILMYELRRKRSIKSNHQSSIDTIYAKVIEEIPKMMRFLVIWNTKHPDEPKVNIVLVEYNNELILNEDKLEQLYENANYMPFNHCRCTWLMCNNTTLRAMHKIMWITDLKLEINISEGVEDRNTMKPFWIDSEKQVSSLIT
jgi:hypothetical protein